MTILYISKGLFCMCIKPFHFEQITYPWFQPLPLKQPYRVIWWEFQISLFRSGFSQKTGSGPSWTIPFAADHLFSISATPIETAIQGDLVGISNFPLQIWLSLKNKSRYNSNHPIWRMSPNLSWCSHHCFGCSRCSRLNQAILWLDSSSLQKMGLGTSWTIQIGGCHFLNCWGFVSILHVSAQLGKLWSWDHQVQNPLEKKHLTIPGSYQLSHIPHAPKSPPSLLIW